VDEIISETIIRVISNDGDLAGCALSSEGHYWALAMDRLDGEEPEEFFRSFPIGLEMKVQTTVSTIEPTAGAAQPVREQHESCSEYAPG
jgi:hypothetical protein